LKKGDVAEADGLHSIRSFTAHFKSGVFQEDPNNISNGVTIVYYQYPGFADRADCGLRCGLLRLRH
jgi:hypothetical protein